MLKHLPHIPPNCWDDSCRLSHGLVLFKVCPKNVTYMYVHAFYMHIIFNNICTQCQHKLVILQLSPRPSRDFRSCQVVFQFPSNHCTLPCVQGKFQYTVVYHHMYTIEVFFFEKMYPERTIYQYQL